MSTFNADEMYNFEQPTPQEQQRKHSTMNPYKVYIYILCSCVMYIF